MKKSYFLILAVLISCQHKHSNEDSSVGIPNPTLLSHPYPFFDFDEIDHYHIDLTEDQWMDIEKKHDKMSINEKKLMGIINDDEPPKSINDNAFLTDINSLYQKNEVDKSKFKEISNIFNEKFQGDYAIAACEPFYRDILIFKKNKAIVGIVKICFQCDLSSIVGTNRNTERFGQNGDYEKLSELLKTKSVADTR